MCIEFNMYVYGFLFVALVVAVRAENMDEGLKKCHRAFHPGVLKCCTSVPNDSVLYEKSKECEAIPKDPINCDHEMCVAKKTGYITDEGEVDKDKVMEVIEKNFSGQTKLLDAIKSKCFDGDIKMYGPPDFCDLIKFKMCFRTQVFVNCPEWNNAGDCKGVKELAAECNKVFS